MSGKMNNNNSQETEDNNHAKEVRHAHQLVFSGNYNEAQKTIHKSTLSSSHFICATNQYGWTMLHILCSYAHKQDNTAWDFFSWCIRQIKDDIICDKSPFFLKTIAGCTPLDVFFTSLIHCKVDDDVERVLEARTYFGEPMSEQERISLVSLIEGIELNPEQGDLCENLSLISKLTERKLLYFYKLWRWLKPLLLLSTPSYRDNPILHRLSYTGGPPFILDHILKLYPDHIAFYDGNGYLPLHVAITSPLLNRSPANCKYSNFIIMLLQAYPESAGCTSLANQFPLHLALEYGWLFCQNKGCCVLQLLLHYAPETLYHVDIKTCLYSFMLAAAYSEAKELHESNIIEFLAIASNGAGMWNVMPKKAQMKEKDDIEEKLELQKLGTIFELLKMLPDCVMH